MPSFESIEALDEYRALGITVSVVESFPEVELNKIAEQFLPDYGGRYLSKEELGKRLTDYALALYNGRSPTLVEFEKYVDELSRERFRTR